MADHNPTDAQRPRRRGRGRGRGNQRSDINNQGYFNNGVSNNGKEDVVNYAPPMQNRWAGTDAKHIQQTSESSEKPVVQWPANHVGGTKPRYSRKNNMLREGGNTEGMHPGAGRKESHVADLPFDHSVDAVAVLAQTILAPPQMAQLIHRLNRLMPISSAPQSAPMHSVSSEPNAAVPLTQERGYRGTEHASQNGGRGHGHGHGRGRGRGHGE